MAVARFPISDFCFVRPTEYSDKVVCRLMGACAVVGGSSVNKWVGDGRARTTDLQHCSIGPGRGRMRSAASQWRGVYQLFIDCATATAVWRQLCGVLCESASDMTGHKRRPVFLNTLRPFTTLRRRLLKEKLFTRYFTSFINYYFIYFLYKKLLCSFNFLNIPIL